MAGRVASISARCGARKPIPTAPLGITPLSRMGKPSRTTLTPYPLFFGLELPPDDLRTRAGRDIEPRIRLPVTLGGASARRTGRLAIILAGFGHPVALLGVKLGLGGRTALGLERQRHGQDRCHCRC